MTAGRAHPGAGDAVRQVDAMAAEADRLLAGADRALAAGYPGPRSGRQPVHTVYVPADRFKAGLAAQWGRQALKALETFAPGPVELNSAYVAIGSRGCGASFHSDHPAAIMGASMSVFIKITVE